MEGKRRETRAQWLIWTTRRRDEGLERERNIHTDFSPTTVQSNQTPARLDSGSSWWAGMWIPRAQRADWWRPRTGRNASTPGASGNRTVGEDHCDLCWHLCHRTSSVSGQGKEGVIGEKEEGRRRGGSGSGGKWVSWAWQQEAECVQIPEEKHVVQCSPTLQGIYSSLWLREKRDVSSQ